MKIEEAVKLYELISNISWIGLLGIFLLVIVVLIGTYSLFIKDKGDKKLNHQNLKLGIISLIIIGISFTILKIDSDNKQELLGKANQLKSAFLLSNWTIMGYQRIQKNIGSRGFNDKTLKKIVKSYPSEFISVVLNDTADSIGIKLTDPAAQAKIDDYKLSHLPFIKESICEYMKTNKIDSMYYNEVRDKIDFSFDDVWITLMLSKYDNIFAPYSVYNSKTDKYSIYKFKLKQISW